MLLLFPLLVVFIVLGWGQGFVVVPAGGGQRLFVSWWLAKIIRPKQAVLLVVSHKQSSASVGDNNNGDAFGLRSKRKIKESPSSRKSSPVEQRTTPMTRNAWKQQLVATIEKYTGPHNDATINHPPEDWKRLHNFLYRNSNISCGLSVKQVNQVMTFLTSHFANNTTSSGKDDNLQVVHHIIQTTPRILGKSVSTQLEPTYEFLATLYPPSMLLYAVQKRPELLLTRGIGYSQRRICGNAESSLNLMRVFLQKEIQLNASQIQELERNSAFLFQLPMYKVLPIVAYFTDIMMQGMTTTTKTKIPKTEMLPSDSQLSKQDENQLNAAQVKVQKELQKLIRTHPTLFQLSLQDNLKPRVEYLRQRCRLEPADVSLLVQGSAAGILGLSVSNNLAPTLDYLQGILAGRNDGDGDNQKTDVEQDLKRCILAHPQILGLSIEQNLKPKVTYFNAISSRNNDMVVGGQPTSTWLAARVLKRAPAVFSLSLTENIIPTIEFLAKIWSAELDLPPGRLKSNQNECDSISSPPSSSSSSSQPSLATLLGEDPSILTLSLERNLMPTIRFYNQTGYIALDANWKCSKVNDNNTNTRPQSLLRARYILSSLYERLLPRWHYCCMHQQRQQDDKKNDNEPLLPLHVLASLPDPAFCRQKGLDYEQYQRFKKDAIPRLKFNSEIESWFSNSPEPRIAQLILP